MIMMMVIDACHFGRELVQFSATAAAAVCRPQAFQWNTFSVRMKLF